jgi:hypothetical protein
MDFLLVRSVSEPLTACRRPGCIGNDATRTFNPPIGVPFSTEARLQKLSRISASRSIRPTKGPCARFSIARCDAHPVRA